MMGEKDKNLTSLAMDMEPLKVKHEYLVLEVFCAPRKSATQAHKSPLQI